MGLGHFPRLQNCIKQLLSKTRNNPVRQRSRLLRQLLFIAIKANPCVAKRYDVIHTGPLNGSTTIDFICLDMTRTFLPCCCQFSRFPSVIILLLFKRPSFYCRVFTHKRCFDTDSSYWLNSDWAWFALYSEYKINDLIIK